MMAVSQSALLRIMYGAIVGVGVLIARGELFAEEATATLATPLTISGDVRNGDIIVYQDITSLYESAREYDAENIIGVVVDDPVLYLESTSSDSRIRPVVRFGEAVVNASTLAGEIMPGDLVTSSPIPGVAARVDPEDASFILGFATGPFRVDASIPAVTVQGDVVRFGTVPIALRIGSYPHEQSTGTSSMTSIGSGPFEDAPDDGSLQVPVDPFKVFRYLLGSTVAIASVVLALKRFGGLFAQSVVSVGRNPLAHSQIRSILIWNAFLIVAVSGVGLGVGIAIIALP